MITTLESICKDIIERAQRNIGATRTIKGKKRRRVASGDLKDSLTYSITKGQRTTKVLFGASGKASKYAGVIEKGRRPNSKPPPVGTIQNPGPIMQWIKTKRLKPRNNKGVIQKMTEARIRSMAFAIAKSIGKNGIEGIHYFEDAIKDTMDERGQELTAALAEQLRIKFLNTKWQ